MKNRKGFTLIELLAVIVILAIIALIAVPIILNMISEARKNAAKSSALGYVDAIENSNAFAQLGTEAGLDEVYNPVVSGDVSAATTALGRHLKGKAPTSGTITVNDKGKVTGADLCFSGYKVVYDGKDVTSVTKGCSGSGGSSTPTVTFGGTKEAAGANDTYKGVVYMDPTDLSANCGLSNAVSVTGRKTGCMQFYIYDDSGSNYKMILDHNTTGTVAWASHDDFIEAGGTEADWTANKTSSQGPVTAIKQLHADTADWDSSLNPRLITADEVAHIVGADRNDTIKWAQNKQYDTYGTNIETMSSAYYLDGGSNSNKTSYSETDGWQKKVATSTNKSKYAWLYNYTDCASDGCYNQDVNITGYWTNDAINSTTLTYGSWIVSKIGNVSASSVNLDNLFGIRPVITVSKSVIDS